MKSDQGGISLRGAGLSLWERISTDPNYLKAKREIQTRYGLPLPYDIRVNDRQWLEWMGAEEKPAGQGEERGREFLKEVHALFKRFEVPDAWYPDFIADIAGLSSEQFKEFGGELRTG